MGSQKTCIKCRQTFPRTDDHFYRNKSGKYEGGFDSYCKECRKACSRGRSKRAVLNEGLLRDFGITVEEFEALSAAQGDVCRICGGPPIKKTRLCVDHDRETKIIRGLLCDLCNRAIGMLHHHPDRIRAAALYVEEAIDVRLALDIPIRPTRRANARRYL